MGLLRRISVFSLVALSFSLSAEAGNRRYVISGVSSEDAEREAKVAGGLVHRKLRYMNGAVADLSDAAVASLRKKLGPNAKIEEDAVAEIQGRAVIIENGQPVGSEGKPATVVPQPVQGTPVGIVTVKAPTAWATTKGATVTVCVVDTGVDRKHPDLMANIAGGENFVVARGRIDPSKFDDDNGHGSHVSGTIAALDNAIGVVGVAPEAKIFAVKVLDRRGSGFVSDIADGIRSCTRNGAKVINMSLGSASGASVLESAINDAIAAGITVVAAAGNESGPVSYPARYAGVVAVSAVTQSLQLASFSNTGPEISFAAPGTSVYSTVLNGSYAAYNGTSMASPHVAGTAALKAAAGAAALVGADIGLGVEEQGKGLIDAAASVKSQ